ncbi:MAG: hypothetical protein ABW321_13955 [Polyangiales bacterium]
MTAPTTIGGFFPLELPTTRGALPPSDAVALSSGRGCLRAILEHMRPARLLAPFYICDAALSPARQLGIPIVRFPIGPDLLPRLPALSPADLVLVVDYFGVCPSATHCIDGLGERGIVDQTHALFAPRNAPHWFFASARKWFGVPDGAFLWGPSAVSPPLTAASSELPIHLITRRWGEPDVAYRAYQQAEATLDDAVRSISELSAALLGGVDVARVQNTRRANFLHLHHRLGAHNQLQLPQNPQNVPFCYPFLPPRPVSRDALRERGLFIPMFWTECTSGTDATFAWERLLAQSLLPLPIDHRYGPEAMDQLAATLEQLIEEAP